MAQNDSKKFGIVVPIYNVEKYLRQCLDSIVNQTYKNLSIILVNDGSTDNSFEIAKEYVLKDERIIIIDKENGGQASARNAGIELFNNEYEIANNSKKNGLYCFKIIGYNPQQISGIYNLKYNLEIPSIDYLQFVDSDDYLELNCLEKCSALNADIDIIWFHLSFIYKLNYKNHSVITPKQLLRDMIDNQIDYFFFVWGGIIRFNFLQKIKLKFLEGIMAEDHIFGISLFLQATNIYILREVLYRYRQSQNSITRGSSLPINIISSFSKGKHFFGIDSSLSNSFLQILQKHKNKQTYRNISKLIVFENIIFFISTLNNDVEIRNLAKKCFYNKYYFSDFVDSYIVVARSKYPITTASSRIKSHLAYKLGSAMILNSKSLWGYIRMPYVLSYIKESHREEQRKYQARIAKNPKLKLPKLESYPDYKEALKEKQCFTYKLGEALIKANNVRGGGANICLFAIFQRSA